MTVPNIDTFEHDIASEIQNRDATLTDIASASGDLGNMPPQAKTSRLLLFLGIGCVLLVVAGGGWYFFMGPHATSSTPEVPIETESQALNLSRLSPTLDEAIGEHVSSISKDEFGYTLTLVNYTPVFAYMIKNESAYADDIASALGSPRDTSTTTALFQFADRTLSNQNMRVGTSGSSTIVYAFVNSRFLIISTSPEGVLKVRSAILSQ